MPVCKISTRKLELCPMTLQKFFQHQPHTACLQVGQKRNSSVQLSKSRGFVTVAHKCFSSFAYVFINKNIEKIKNAKNVTKIKKREKHFYIYDIHRWYRFLPVLPVLAAVQEIDTSSPCAQLCCDHPRCPQSARFVSVPLHCKSSIQITPSPRPYSLSNDRPELLLSTRIVQ